MSTALLVCERAVDVILRACLIINVTDRVVWLETILVLFLSRVRQVHSFVTGRKAAKIYETVVIFNYYCPINFIEQHKN